MDKVVEKAYGMLAFIGRDIEYRNWKILLQLYKTLVRPHLDYCVQSLSPHYQKNADALEKVQKRYMRKLPRLEDMVYEERLNKH